MKTIKIKMFKKNKIKMIIKIKKSIKRSKNLKNSQHSGGIILQESNFRVMSIIKLKIRIQKRVNRDHTLNKKWNTTKRS